MDIESKNIHLIQNFPEEEIILGLDPIKLRLVLQNLISNALKFTDEEGKIEVSLEDYDDNILIQVSDNGIGIPEDQLENIFEKFTRFKRSGVRGEESVGLGLSISKRIVELHKGKIDVESEEGKGSTLPLLYQIIFCFPDLIYSITWRLKHLLFKGTPENLFILR